MNTQQLIDYIAIKGATKVYIKGGFGGRRFDVCIAEHPLNGGCFGYTGVNIAFSGTPPQAFVDAVNLARELDDHEVNDIWFFAGLDVDGQLTSGDVYFD